MLIRDISREEEVEEEREADQDEWVSKDIGSMVNEDTCPWEIGIELQVVVSLDCVLG